MQWRMCVYEDTNFHMFVASAARAKSWKPANHAAKVVGTLVVVGPLVPHQSGTKSEMSKKGKGSPFPMRVRCLAMRVANLLAVSCDGSAPTGKPVRVKLGFHNAMKCRFEEEKNLTLK